MNFEMILNQLETGDIRSAIKTDGKWKANKEVKMAILESFKNGTNRSFGGFIDKNTLPPRKFTIDDNIRLVPGGTSVRRGAHISSGVIIMPPSYINVGAFVDEGTMIDSHVLVGSCAQIGKNVHLSAGVQIGGVLEPIGMSPVVIEDNSFIGAGVVIVEGIQVGSGAIIAPGVTLSKSIPIYDTVNSRMLDQGEMIPCNAIVVPGTRPIKSDKPWAKEMGLNLNCAIIIKYRDEHSDASTELERVLR